MSPTATAIRSSAALVGDHSGVGVVPHRSGTLVSPTVFLAAAHRDLGNPPVRVTFDEVWDASTSSVQARSR